MDDTQRQTDLLQQLNQKDPFRGVQQVTLKGDKGETPVKGKDYFTPEEVRAFLQAATPIKGVHYNDGMPGYSPHPDVVASLVHSRLDLNQIAERASQLVQQPENDPDEFIDTLHKSKKLINPRKIKGLMSIMKAIDEQGRNPQGHYQNVGGANPTIFQDSTGTRISDYITTVKLSTNLTGTATGGVLTITASGSGGTGFQAPTGAVNGSNTVFVFSTAPSAICVDQGRIMQKTSSDGTVNWTGTTTVTLTIAPNFDIFSVA